MSCSILWCASAARWCSGRVGWWSRMRQPSGIICALSLSCWVSP